MIKAALFVEGTFLPSREGATRRFLGLARKMLAHGISVVVIHCYRGWSDLEAIAREPFQTYALAPSVYYGNPRLLSRILDDERIDLCMFAEAETVLTVGIPQKERSSHLRIWYECHDVHGEFFETTGASKQTIRAARRVQEAALASAELVTCFTCEDHASLAALLGSKDRVFSVGFGIESPDIRWRDSEGSKSAVVFVGNIYHRPNQLAVEAISHHILPGLVDRGICVDIIGDVPDSFVQEHGSPSLRFRGAVKDLHRELAQYAVAIAPIQTGSGIKVKVLDYLAASRPTVGTSLAFRGIGERHGIRVDRLSQYPGLINRIISTKSELARCRSEAWAGAEAQSWSQIARPLGDLLRSASTKTRVEPSSGQFETSVLEPYFLSDYKGQCRFDPAPFTPFSDEKSILKLGWKCSVALSS